MKLQIESLDDIKCGCGHNFPTERYKEVMGGVDASQNIPCAIEVIKGLVEGEMSLIERMFLIDMIVMRLITTTAMEAALLDHAIQHMPSTGRGDN